MSYHVKSIRTSKVAAVPDKYDHIDFKPPQSVADAAAKGLEYRAKASPSNKGGLTPSEAAEQGIGSGVQRAVNLKNRDNISPEVINQMVAFFSRHEKNKTISSEHRDEPWNDKGYVSWLIWGGDPGRAWAERVKGQMESADNKKTASMKLALDTKKWGPFTFEIDRPKGFVKTWDQPDGSVKKFKYPCDYGYFIEHTGEDDEGLDAFVGDDPQGKIESFLKMRRDDSGELIPDETKFMVGLSDAQREKVIGLYQPEEIVGLREYTDFYELIAALNAFKDRKKQARMEMTRRVVAQHLEAPDPLADLTEELKGLEALAQDIQAVVDTFLETVPMPHVGRIASLQLRSQTECFSKCEHAARHAQRVINMAHSYLQSHPGDATATSVVRDAGMLLEKFDTYRVKSREMMSALSQKIMPTALKSTVTYVVDGVRAELYEPSRLSVTVFPHPVPTKVGDRTVDGVVFDTYLTVFPSPMDTAAGLPKYQQFLLTQSTIGDTDVYLTAIDRTNVLDPTKPVAVGAPTALKKILGYLGGWSNLLSVHTTDGTRTAASSVTLDGVKCTWKRAPKRSGRMSMGSAPNQFRPWTLEAPDGRFLAMVTHTHDVPSYATPKEDPAWKISIRLLANDADKAKHGTYIQFNLKARFPAPNGDEDMESVRKAQDLAVIGYQKQKERYEGASKTAAKAPSPPPPSAPSVVTYANITSSLKRMNLKRGGRVVRVDFEPGSSPFWSVEPSNRERLDHYGNDGDGWDEDGWEYDYAGPLRETAEKWLSEEFGPGLFYVDVGDKGHLDIQLSPAGAKKFSP